MRHAHSTIPWFLALVLSCLSACDDLFSVPACDFDRNHVLCMQQKGGEGAPGGGDMATGPGAMPDMASPPLMKPAVSFTLVASSALRATRKWVGLNSEKFILFSEQSSNDATITSFKLENTSSLAPRACLNCPTLIKNVDFNADKILASRTLFFLVKSDFAYLLKTTGELSTAVNSSTNLSIKYRPFTSPDFDILAYQKNIKNNEIPNSSEISIYPSQGDKQTITFPSRANTPTITTYYAFGNLSGSGDEIAGKNVLIFEDNALRSAYTIDTTLMPIFDNNLTIELGTAIRIASGLNDGYPIRSAFISDLNADGYMELIFARKQHIYILTYNPYNPIGSRFINQTMSNFKIESVERTETMIVSDLNNDGYPELAIEIHNPDIVQFYLNNTK